MNTQMVDSSLPAIFLRPGWLMTTFTFDNWRGFIGSTLAQSLFRIKPCTADPGKNHKWVGPQGALLVQNALPKFEGNALKQVSFLMKNAVVIKRGE